MPKYKVTLKLEIEFPAIDATTSNDSPSLAISLAKAKLTNDLAHGKVQVMVDGRPIFVDANSIKLVLCRVDDTKYVMD